MLALVFTLVLAFAFTFFSVCMATVLALVFTLVLAFAFTFFSVCMATVLALVFTLVHASQIAGRPELLCEQT